MYIKIWKEYISSIKRKWRFTPNKCKIYIYIYAIPQNKENKEEDDQEAF